MKSIYGILLSVVFVATCFAQEHDHAASEKLGAVHFETSCALEAQMEFDHAVALLHSFQFGRTRDALQRVLKADPNCAMAYWAQALVEWSNPFAPGVKSGAQIAAGHKAAEQGLALKPKTERERAYLNAVAKLYTDSTASTQARMEAYRDAMAKLSAEHPEDHEAAIYYALALAQSEPLGDKKHEQRLKAGAILEKLSKEQPEHPGLAHYIIHAYDVPDLADRAVDAARRYASIAPDAPHALHMPSHTFTRVGYWQESIGANIAAAKAAEREKQYSEELHAMDYQMYAYLQTGQDEAGRRLLESMPTVVDKLRAPTVQLRGAPSETRSSVTVGAAPPSAGHFAIAALPARYALERQDWERAAAIKPAESPIPYADAMSWFARGMGAARLKQVSDARGSIVMLAGLAKKLGDAHEEYWRGQVEIQMIEVKAWTRFAEGKKDEALELMEDAVFREDATDKSAVTPGPLAPARELMGEMLMELGKPKLALEQFELTLKKEPGRFRTLYGAAHAAKLIGNKEVSQKYFAQLIASCERGDKLGRAELAEARKQ